MLRSLQLWLGLLPRCFRSHRRLLLENLALRQQLAVFKRKHRKPKLSVLDKCFWIFVRRFWSAWKHSLLIVTPETVARWHRAGFRRYWAMISKARRKVGRKKLSREARELIFRMIRENPTWGAPRIHGELRMLGFDVSERTVSRWMKRAPKDPESGRRWLSFLHNHREVIAAMDLFTVPTLTFGVLYCFFIIGHGRRRILHCGVTKHPTSLWIGQQLREAFPYEASHKYLIHDRDAKFGVEVFASLKSVGLEPVRTSFKSPWQNGVAERWVGSCRRELLDHVIAFNERHLKRLLSEYVLYYHDDHTHVRLNKGTPSGRCTQQRGSACKILAMPRLGGLHHRYDLAA